MRTIRFIGLIILILAGGDSARGRFQVRPVGGGDWYLESIKVPANIKVAHSAKPVVIAIVDDGVRVTHRDLKDFIWVNSKEVPGNGVDDDGNGYVDDVGGWDVSDGDNDPTPSEKRLKTFYHGTHLAGVIARIARKAYGDSAAEYVKIMPVKALGDKAQRTYIKDGYKGVEHALKAGADVILCAWGVGYISDNDSRILKRAAESGVLVVASAGSFPEQRDQYPAAHDAVIAVAGLTRQNKKTAKSNFGGFVDISAPGIDILGADAGSDDALILKEGSSQSAAMVAAAGAMVKVRHGSYSAEQVRACLKASAIDIARYNPRYTAKLGAGKLNVRGAIESRLFIDDTEQFNRLANPQGYLRFHSTKGKAVSWTIKPVGDFKGLRFRSVSITGEAGESVVKFYKSVGNGAKPLLSYPLNELPDGVYVPGMEGRVVIEPKGAAGLEWLAEYRAEPIDFRTMYCSGTTELDEEGTFEDGSGDDNYAFHSDCKWLITAPEGKVVKITFTEFDTEPRTDLVYFFNGAGTHEKIMAVFSGPDIPPELTTWRNQVLVWFVTDGKNQGKGFKAKYEFVDP